MKTIILAGGLGTRLAEETQLRPKPMVEIGGIPILAHILSVYHQCGYRDFLIACGYKGELIHQYFDSHPYGKGGSREKTAGGQTDIGQTDSSANLPDWNVQAVDTGAMTMTGGRLLRLANRIGDETFMVTYGDGLADIDIRKLVAFHRSHGRLATVTAVHPPARFGCLDMQDGMVCSFTEKPQTGEGWINGGYFVFEPEVFEYLDGDQCVLEGRPLERLSQEQQLMAYCHEGFWQPMDTLREKQLLEELWNNHRAPWKGSQHDDFFRGLSRPKSLGDRPDWIQGPVARSVA